MRNNYSRNPALLLLLILVGILTGSVLGQALGQVVPFLSHSVQAGFPPVTLRLADALQLTLGFNLKFNFATVLGVIAAVWGYRRL